MTRTWALRWVRVGTVATLVGCASLVAVMAMDGGASAGAAVHAGRADAASTLGALVIPNLAPGYTVTAQGSPNASQFASDAPDPSAAAGALSTLGGSISTYERVWQSDGGRNQVQDLLVRFPDPVRAQVFLQAAQHSLETGEIVSSDPLPSIPGARRITYFGATNHDGIGEAITLRAGVYVDLLSIFSAAAGKAHPLSPADAERLAETQHAALATGSRVGPRPRRRQAPRRPAARRAPRPAPSGWPWSSSPSWRWPWPPRACCGGAVGRRRPRNEPAVALCTSSGVSRRRG